jgi:hypothetical protein
VAEREVISSPIAIFRLLFSNKYLFLLFGEKGLPQVYKRMVIHKDDSTLLIVLGFFFPMAAAMIVQNDINKLYN